MRRVVFAMAALALSCSSGGGTTDGGAGDGGGDGGAPTSFTQKGRVIDFTLKSGEPDATVTVGSTTAKTDANGLYSIKVPANQPFSFSLTGDMKIKLIEQERILSGDVDQGDTNHVSVTTQNLLKALITDYDPKLASLGVGVNKRGACASIDGVTVDLDPPQAAAKIRYFQGGLPSMNPSGMEGQLPTAIVYNIDPSKPVRVKATHPTCKMVAYPVKDPDKPTLSYTGNVTVEAGDVTSYVRV